MGYDVNAAIEKPNVWDAFQQGRMQAQQIKQDQNELAQQEQAVQDRNALRGYASGIIAGDPGAFDQAAAIDPQAAMQYQSAGDQQLKRLKGAIDFIDRAQTPEQKEAAYRQVRPYLNRMSPDGVEPPMTFAEAAPKMEEARARIAMIGNDGPQGAVQSTFIDNQGNRVAIMRDGSTQVLGQNAPNFRAIDTGNGYVGFNPLNNTAAPTMIQGAQQPPPIMPAAPQQFTGADGVPVQIDGDLPPNVQAAIRQAEMQGGAVPNGATLQAAPQVVQASGGMPTGGAMPGQLTSAPKPSEVMAQQNQALQMARFSAQQARTLAPEEVQAAGYRPGTIVQVDGYGNQKVVQAPSQDRQSMSEAQRKDMLARRAKVPQLQNAIRGMGRIEQALSALEGGMVNTGPVDAMVQRYTPQGQELEAAVGGIQNSILALTRVPGIGAQSDLEARIAALQYPSLDKPPEVNRRTLEQLKFFMRDLAKAYESAMQEDAAGTVSPATSPALGGWSIKAID